MNVHGGVLLSAHSFFGGKGCLGNRNGAGDDTTLHFCGICGIWGVYKNWLGLGIGGVDGLGSVGGWKWDTLSFYLIIINSNFEIII